jgi:hypothetical protein
MRTFVAAAIVSIASASYDEMDIKFMMHCAKFGLSWKTIEEYNFRKNIF